MLLLLLQRLVEAAGHATMTPMCCSALLQVEVKPEFQF